MAIANQPIESKQEIPTQVTEEEYLAVYAEQGYEWVEGELIKLSPIELKSLRLVRYLNVLLESYFELQPIGQVLGEPFVIQVSPRRYREPDLMVVLNTNPHLTETMVKGAADICIEVISPESIERDYGKKFVEYEKLGVPEYWILDLNRQASNFNRLNTYGTYIPVLPDANGVYQTPLLPSFKLDVLTLWKNPLPTVSQIVALTKAMLAE